MKKILLMLAAVLALSTNVPAQGSAKEGECGNGLRWEINDDGVLWIQGLDVAMGEYTPGEFPWSVYSEEIKAILLSGGTTISEGAFKDLKNVESFSSIAAKLQSVGDRAFDGCTSLRVLSIFADEVPTVATNAFANMTLKEDKKAGQMESVDATLYVPYEQIGEPLQTDKATYLNSAWNQLSIVNVEAIWAQPGASKTFKDIQWSLSEDGLLELWPRSDLSSADFELEWPWESPFYQNKYITEVYVHKGVEAIGSGAFMGCKNLRKAVLEDVVDMGRSSNGHVPVTAFPFTSCPNLEVIELCYGICDFPNGIMYDDMHSSLRIAVPQSAVEYFKEDEFWGRFQIYALPAKASGEFAKGLQWSVSYDGVLTILGKGEIPDYTSFSQTPWADYRMQIKRIIVCDGVSRIGAFAFNEVDALYSNAEIFLPATLFSIGDNAFGTCSQDVQFTCMASPQVPVLDSENAIRESAGNHQQTAVYVWSYMLEDFKADAKWNRHKLLPLTLALEDISFSELTAEIIDETTIYVTWPSIAGGVLYTITLTGPDVKYTIVTDEKGNVVETSIEEVSQAAPIRRVRKEEQKGYGVTLRGLQPGEYQIMVVAKDADDAIIGDPMITVTNTIKDRLPEAIENVQETNKTIRAEKQIMDGHVFIRQGEKLITVQGQEIQQ